MRFLQSLQTLITGGNRQVEILVLGFDNSGKSTILNQLKAPEEQSASIAPTVGHTVEKFHAANLHFTAYDMSGQTRYRNLWETHYKSAHGIIFVIDSSDRLRMAVARDELWMLLDHKDLVNRKVPLLIFANKSDLKDAQSSADIHLNLGLNLIRGRNWSILSCCALTGEGLVAGIDWLATNIKDYLSAASSQ